MSWLKYMKGYCVGFWYTKIGPILLIQTAFCAIFSNFAALSGEMEISLHYGENPSFKLHFITKTAIYHITKPVPWPSTLK